MKIGKRWKKYGSFFRIRFLTGLQYRVAALAGVSTQFAWGFLNILLYHAFYQASPEAFPMGFGQLADYIWLRQGFLALVSLWTLDSDIFEQIRSGGIAYELCKPAGLYGMWYVKNTARRLSAAALRCLPIFLVTWFLPEPFRLHPPASPQALLLFLVSLTLGLGVMVAFTMLLYIATMHTLSPLGIRMVAVSLVEFLSGSLVPLNFLPRSVQRVLELAPFSAVQNVPLRVYSGNIAGEEAAWHITLQMFWLGATVGLGWLLMRRAQGRIVAQGG